MQIPLKPILQSLVYINISGLWSWTRIPGSSRNGVVEIKINTGIYIFCSSAGLASCKCISDLNLNNRDQNLPSLLCTESSVKRPCCHRENILNIERLDVYNTFFRFLLILLFKYWIFINPVIGWFWYRLRSDIINYLSSSHRLSSSSQTQQGCSTIGRVGCQ